MKKRTEQILLGGLISKRGVNTIRQMIYIIRYEVGQLAILAVTPNLLDRIQLCSIKRLSSRNTIVLPLLRAFFYTWPILLSPSCDGIFITLSGTFFRFLTAPPHTLQNVPDTGEVIGKTKMVFDYLCDSLQGPQFSGITISTSTF